MPHLALHKTRLVLGWIGQRSASSHDLAIVRNCLSQDRSVISCVPRKCTSSWWSCTIFVSCREKRRATTLECHIVLYAQCCLFLVELDNFLHLPTAWQIWKTLCRNTQLFETFSEKLPATTLECHILRFANTACSWLNCATSCIFPRLGKYEKLLGAEQECHLLRLAQIHSLLVELRHFL